jgi:hypothetical protein
MSVQSIYQDDWGHVQDRNALESWVRGRTSNTCSHGPCRLDRLWTACGTRRSGSRSPRPGWGGWWATIAWTIDTKSRPALLGQRHRQDPCPALGDKPLQPSGVLLGAEFADHRRDEVAPIALKTHRAGGEATRPRSRRRALRRALKRGDPLAGVAARSGVRLLTGARHQVGNVRGVPSFEEHCHQGATWPFGLVPRPGELVEIPRQQRDSRVRGAGVEVGLNGGRPA